MNADSEVYRNKDATLWVDDCYSKSKQKHPERQLRGKKVVCEGADVETDENSDLQLQCRKLLYESEIYGGYIKLHRKAISDSPWDQ